MIALFRRRIKAVTFECSCGFRAAVPYLAVPACPRCGTRDHMYFDCPGCGAEEIRTGVNRIDPKVWPMGGVA